MVTEVIILLPMAKLPKRPRDSAQLAKFIVEIASGERVNDKPVQRPAQSKGGKARAAKLSTQKRRAIAKKGAAARWRKK